MHKLLISGGVVISLMMTTTQTGFAQTPNRFRFDAEVGVATLNLPAPYRMGTLYQQQLTGSISPRLGVALGLSWGSSANRDPLKTTYGGQPGSGIPQQPDPVALRSFYQRSEQMTDLALVYRPIVSRQHQVSVQVGLSAYRRREFGVDSVRFSDPQRSYYETVGKFIDTRRVVPVVALSYKFQVSSRWAVGLTGKAYFTGSGPATTSLGLHGTYRFNVLADSLGITAITTSDLRVGIRAGAIVPARTGSTNPGQVYRARFVGGIWAELPLSLLWAIRGEFNYVQRGYRVKETQTSGGRYLAASGNLNYLDVPLLFRHEIAYRWHLYGGPYLSFFLNGYTEVDGQRESAVRPHTISGLALGTSYSVTDQLGLDLRYQRDLIELSTTAYGNFQNLQAALTWQLSRKR